MTNSVIVKVVDETPIKVSSASFDFDRNIADMIFSLFTFKFMLAGSHIN